MAVIKSRSVSGTVVFKAVKQKINNTPLYCNYLKNNGCCAVITTDELFWLRTGLNIVHLNGKGTCLEYNFLYYYFVTSCAWQREFCLAFLNTYFEFDLYVLEIMFVIKFQLLFKKFINIFSLLLIIFSLFYFTLLFMYFFYKIPFLHYLS